MVRKMRHPTHREPNLSARLLACGHSFGTENKQRGKTMQNSPQQQDGKGKNDTTNQNMISYGFDLHGCTPTLKKRD